MFCIAASRERVTQECNSFIEGLPCKTFHDPYEYDWAQQLRDKASIIQEEFTRVAIEGSDDLDKKGNNVWATAANATSAQSYGALKRARALTRPHTRVSGTDTPVCTEIVAVVGDSNASTH